MSKQRLYHLLLCSVLAFFSFSVSAQDATEVNISGSTATYSIPNNTATVVAPELTIDANGNIDGFTVTITGSYTSGDVLSYTGSLPAGVSTSGFSTATRAIQFTGSASPTVWQEFLRRITLSTTSAVCFPEQRQISFNFGPFYYNPLNEHFYILTNSNTSWTSARDVAAASSYYGYQGYLATITSAAENSFISNFINANSWIGCSDNVDVINGVVGYQLYPNQSEAEGNFYWVTGPESGIHMRTGNAGLTTPETAGSPIAGVYQNWSGGEPNDWPNPGIIGEEDYGHAFSNGLWNDYANTQSIRSIVEYGGMPNDQVNSTVVFTKTVGINGAPTSPITGGNVSVCPGGSASLSLPGFTGTVVRWESSPSNFLTAGTTISSTSTTLDLTNITETLYYRAIVNTSSPSCSNLSTSSTLITVSETVPGNAIPVTPTICAGADASLSLFGNEGSVLSWEIDDNTGFSSPETISSTSVNLTHTISSTGTWYFRALVQNEGCGSAEYSGYAPVTVNSGTPPVGGTVSSETFCGGSNSGTLTLSGQSGTISKWQYSTTNGLIWTDISNTSTSQAFSGISATRLYRAVLTNGSCGSSSSAPGSVTVYNFQAANSGVVCPGSELSLGVTATGGNGPFTFAWSGPDGFSSDEQNPVIVSIPASGAGDYVVEITAPGCDATEQTTVSLLDGPVPALVSSSSPTCFGGDDGSATVEATGGEEPYSWLWAPDGGDAETASDLSAGNYTATVTDDQGCSASLDVEIQNPAELAETISPTACDSTTINGVTYTESGTYTQNLTNGDGCDSTLTINLTIINYETEVTSNSPVCAGGTFEISVDAGASFLINGPAGYSSAEQISQIESVSEANAGTYYISVEGANGCFYYDTLELAVNPLPDVSVTPAGPIEFCEGESVNLSLLNFETTTAKLNVAGTESGAPVDCNCPPGYVAVGYTGRSGAWLDQVKLACKQLNGDGSLGSTVVYTDPNGGNGGNSNGPYLFSGTEVMVGMRGNERNAANMNWVSGYKMTVADVQNQTDPAGGSTLSPNLGSGATSGTTNSIYVPAGAVVVGMRKLNAANGYTSTFQLNYMMIDDVLGSFEWSNGESTPTITVTEAGFYNVTLTDENGCSNTSNTVEVIVNPLNIFTQDDITIYADENCSAIVNYDEPPTQECIGTITYSIPSGSNFSVGQTQVTKTVTDYTGGQINQNFTVTVLDTISPVSVSCPEDITVTQQEGLCGAIVNYDTPQFGDNCATPVTVSFEFTENTVEWTVPAGVTEIEITAAGASGERSYVFGDYWSEPGSGAVVTSTVSVTPGQVLYITTGGAGTNGAGGFNGGGSGGVSDFDPAGYGGGGGGLTSTGFGGHVVDDTLIVAGGGGGSGWELENFGCWTFDDGGNGGTPIGGNGLNCSFDDSEGGSLTAGGNGSEAGSYMLGGNGANTFDIIFQGGGGAGFYGGGSGILGGGGGGSSYVSPLLGSNTNYDTGNTGNGYATITYTPVLTATLTEGFESGEEFPQGTTTVTYTGTDPSGNSIECSFQVTVDLLEHNQTLTICTNEGYNFNGTLLTESGIYTDTFTSSLDCDSLVTLDLTIKHPTEGEITETACDSYTINGEIFTESGVYTQTLVNAAGCDSTLTINLTVNSSSSNEITATACDSYEINGETFTESGTFTQTLVNTAGCDSTLTINLTIKNSSTAEIAETACNSFIANGEIFTESGIYTQTLVNAAGCDSTLTINLTINNSSEEEITTTACDSYSLNGETFTQSGVYIQTLENAAGCDSTLTLNLTINTSSTEEITATACDSYSLNGETFTQSGVYTQTLENATGCDSTITLNLTINTSSTEEITATACDSYGLNGETFTQSGVYTQILENAGGCDSTITLNVTINNSSSEELTETACDSYSLNGETFTQSGVYTQTLENAAGCDSTITLNLTINSSSSNEITETACDSYSINGETFTESGVYSQTLTNAAGCDSTLTINLTIGSATAAEITETACESYSVNGETFTESGVYTQVLPNAVGCDSTLTINLTINSSSAAEITETACDSYSINGETFTESGVYTQALPNALGCDSTITLNLTINNSTATEITETACDSYSINGETFTESGVYTQTLTNAAGCDSTLTINLTIGSGTTEEITMTACDSYSLNGETFTQSGVYTQTLENAAGCDSTITLNLTINTSSTEEITETACDSYSLNGETFTQSGVYTQTLENAAGCDSTITLNLTINSSSGSFEMVSACESYKWNGTIYTESGTYTFETTNAAGCDSVATLNLVINLPQNGEETISACNEYLWNGSIYNESGIYTFETSTVAGCDSTATLNLTINQSSASQEEASACDSYSWNGTDYTESGTYVFQTTNASGCDSTVTLTLTIFNSSALSIDMEACGSYTLNDEVYTESGVYTQTLLNAAGCDSIITLNLSILEQLNQSIEASACDSYSLNGETYTESGVYTQTFTSALGCDSILTINLTINNSDDVQLEMSACDSYNWNGTDYTESGVYTAQLVNAAGCDSTVTLTLTINQSVEETVVLMVNQSITINGVTYDESGVYIQMLSTTQGCDSVVTYNITVSQIAGDTNGNGVIDEGEVAGDVDGNGVIDEGEIAGDLNGDGVITEPEIAGDANGNGVIDEGEIAGDINGDGVITEPEIAGDTNGNGVIDEGEIAGDVDGNGVIDDGEIAGDVNGDGVIDEGEIAGDVNGDGVITEPEIAGDVNGDGEITQPEIAGDVDGNGVIDDGEIAGDLNGDGTINGEELEGDANGDGELSCIDLIFMGTPVNTAVSVQDATITAEEDQGVTYQWVNCSTLEMIAGATSQSYTATANGLYKVIITDNLTGCSDTSNCVPVTKVGISSVSNESLELYPNPSNTAFSLKGMNGKSVIEVRDAAGRLIESRQSNQTKEIFSSENLASGVYFITVTSDRKQETLRLVVGH